MKPASRLDHRTGLTLAELMIALVIGSLVLVITAQASGNIRRWTTRLAQAEEENTKAADLYQFMETMLSDVLLLRQRVNGNEITLFEGSENALRFMRAEPGYPARVGIYQYSFFSESIEDEQWAFVMLRELQTDPVQFKDFQNPARLVLYTGSQPPEFAYNGKTGWQKEWLEKPAPPRLVQFSIAGWPALSITLPSPVSGINAKKESDDTAKKKDDDKKANSTSDGEASP